MELDFFRPQDPAEPGGRRQHLETWPQEPGEPAGKRPGGSWVSLPGKGARRWQIRVSLRGEGTMVNLPRKGTVLSLAGKGSTNLWSFSHWRIMVTTSR